MMMMAIPLIGLYEISIIIGRVIESRRRRRRVAEEAAEKLAREKALVP
jgi:Sec-independent protein secretion pathway component TatC